ncbi:MAG: polysaccharide biosynthesis tyrosine autokinase [Verrucomicrobia bacterium]|nr:polysaccharide biosynthesis tyrosine autokinase [Verrucomicrobiota bacterium]MDA1045426.1 polysaccharide biosynthesis tyrosine autokinase [Verrucomicrobiota bacterium]
MALSLPIALGFVYKEYQQPSIYQSSSSFRLVPPPAILNLQPVEQANQLVDLVRKHTEGLNGQELRVRVLERVKDNSSYKSTMLAPYVYDDEQLPDIASTVSYYVSVGGEGRPVFTITATGRSSQSVQLVADLVQQEYEKSHTHEAGAVVETAREILESLLATSQSRESHILGEMTKYKGEKELPFVEDERLDNASRKSSYHSEITKAKVEKVRINSLLRQIIQIQASISSRAKNDGTAQDVNANIDAIKDYFKIDAIQSFGNVPALQTRLFDLEQTHKLYGQKYLSNHPKMIENARQVQDVERILQLEVKASIEDLKDTYHQLEAQEQEFATAMDKVQSESVELSEMETNLAVLDRKLQIQKGSTDTIQRRLQDVVIQIALPIEQDDPLHKGSVAYPGTQISPNLPEIHKIGFIIFGVLFVLIPFGFEFIDNRIKSPWDIEVFLGQDLLAGIPKISEVKESDRPLIVGNELDDGLTEAFRSMYSRIQMHSKTDYPKTILITSAIPSEGKSLLAANLAYSCANHGRKTILIDFDLRRPGLHKFCGVSNDRGLLTLINETVTNPTPNYDFWDSGTLVEIYPNLLILPSGGKTRAATEMLEKPEFDKMLFSLRQNAEIIIIDSPPIGLFPDSLAMARKVDEVIFVTRYGKVARKVAKSLIESLEETGVNLLGVVLNDLPEKKTPGYYYSGYYGYGYFRYKYYNKYYNKYYGKHGPEKAQDKTAKVS